MAMQDLDTIIEAAYDYIVGQLDNPENDEKPDWDFDVEEMYHFYIGQILELTTSSEPAIVSEIRQLHEDDQERVRVAVVPYLRETQAERRGGAL
jgi:hypothetical protein